MFYLLNLFWFIRTTKAILFWLYLWQLKEYHTGRFLDHFWTEKGKQLIFNKANLIKLILLFSFPAIPLLLFFVLTILYILESIKTLIDFLRKRLKKPVLTKKTIFLILVGVATEILAVSILFFNVKSIVWLAFWLLVFDVLSPLITSVIVLLSQPIAVLARNQVIKRAKEKRDGLKNLLVVGITGSYGKTSTKEFLSTILSEKYKVLKTKEHQNSEIGISQCILDDLKPEHEIFVCEMGAYNRGGIRLLCDITKPKIGILTGINEQHMATFGSQEDIIKTKYELIESLPGTGLAIFNGENSYCLELYKKTEKPKKLYSSIPAAVEKDVFPDIWAADIRIEKTSLSFRVFSKEGEFAQFKVDLAGEHNISNILAAVSCAKELGMGFEEISEACKKISPEQGAMKISKGINGLNIIDSTYSSNPKGVMAALDYLNLWPGKKTIVMPCLIELGKATVEVHKRIGGKIGEVCDLAIITTKERFKEIKRETTEKGMKKENILFLENPEEIIEKIKSFSKPGDIILLEGRVSKKVLKELKAQ